MPRKSKTGRGSGKPRKPKTQQIDEALDLPSSRVSNAGRKPDYKLAFCEIAAELYGNGATDIEVADALDVHVSTLYRWHAKYPEFREASKLGKEAADNRVARSLYNRAVGYSFDSVKVFQFEGFPVVVPFREHVPPDVGAQKHWLANRDRENWGKDASIELSADTAFLELLKHVSGER